MSRKNVLVWAAVLLPALIVAVGVAPKNQLFVGGRLVSESVLLVKGQAYIPVSDLAKYLSARVSITKAADKGQTVRLTLASGSQKQPRDGKAAGSVSGVVTYYFNENYGTRPDVGSVVLVLPGRVQLPYDKYLLFLDDDLVLTSSLEFNADESKESKVRIVKRTAVDGNGAYHVSGIEPGTYTLLIKSSHRSGTSHRDIRGNVYCQTLQITSGCSVDVTYEFTKWGT